MKNAVLIFGESGCGKSSIKKAILKMRSEYNEVITSTTRPPRDGEVNGVDYNFRSEAEMADMIMADQMLECVSFRDWVYGTEKSAMTEDAINIGVWNPEGVETLNEFGDIICLNIYIGSKDKVRIMRSLNREENPDVEEILRRYQADKRDFDSVDVGFFVTIENNGEKSVDEIAEEIVAVIDRRLGRFV